MRFAKTRSQTQEDTRKVKTQTTRQTVEVRADGEGLVSHAGAFLLVELADRLGLTKALSAAMAPTRERRSAHDPGVVLRDLAVAVADGGDHITDLGVLRGQEALFGPVASETTAHRVVKSIGADLLEAIRAARAEALAKDAGIRFSVGYEVDQRVRGVIGELPEAAWQSAIDGDGAEREGAQVTELSDDVGLSSWPEGTRLICRREQPHPGAQLSVLDCETGYRHTAFITDQADEDIAALELRHRRRAKVEDAIRVAKETGMRRMPFATFEHNAAWLEISLAAQALLRWAARLCLGGELALAEPKRVRQRLLHVAGRLVRSGRRVALRLPRSWPWAEALVAAFARLRALPIASSP
jgi:hypothetical protein